MTKVVLISDTFIKGKPHFEGASLDLDELTPDGTQIIGELHAAGRIVVHGSEGHKLYEKNKAQTAKAAK